MAAKTYLFQRKFPLLIASSVLAVQPLTALYSVAEEQYACQISASGGWDCTTFAADPTLPARPTVVEKVIPKPSNPVVATSVTAAVATEKQFKSTLGRTVNYADIDWVPQDQLTEEQQAEMGAYCGGRYIEPLRPGMDDTTPIDEVPTYLSAKVSRYDQQNQVATLAGDVVMRQASQQAEADEAHLYQLENRGELVGNVKLRDNGALITGSRAEIQLDNGAAQIEDVNYVMHQSGTRGEARYAKREESAIIRLKDGTYTRCAPGSNTWYLRGNNIKLDPNTGFGSATNVTLRVKDVPVFYTPYIYFPIDDRRLSGFLAPSFSTSGRRGTTLITPYYFNLAPNYDATLYPQYMSKRGLMLEGEFRYLGQNSRTEVSGSFLSDKEDERKLQTDYTKDRWLVNLQHDYGYNQRLLGEIDYTDISDPYFFDDLSSSLPNVTSASFVDQKGSLTWRGDSYTARLGVHAYERANITDLAPYDKMPQLTLNGSLPFEPAGLRFAYNTELVRFDRDLTDKIYRDKDGKPEINFDQNVVGISRATGNRLYLAPEMSLPINWSWGYVTPKIKLTYTKYDLDIDSRGRRQMTANNQKFRQNQSRTVPIYSIDSGLYFDRNTTLFGSNYRQTLEPRLYYLYVPYEDQSDIPVFDTGESTFNYNTMFRDNRFTGRDRIGDENRISLGLTNRWIDEKGIERQRLSIGQAFYMRDRKVQMPGVMWKDKKDATYSQSPYALEYMLRLSDNWRFTSDYVWDKNTHSPRSGSAMFHYQDKNDLNKIFNIGYRFRNDFTRYNRVTGVWETSSDYGSPGQANYVKNFYKVDQSDVSVMWPIMPRWNAIARWQYDYNGSRTLDAFGGFEYDSCCWKVRLVQRYWVDYDEYSQNPNDNRKGDRGVFLQVILKGLGTVSGAKVDTFLDDGIRGYREREDNAL
ncbi:LPS-assembly protein LptD [Pseudomonas sp. F1_0610]|uniref:LPS-assembly protein LptD n=1 Tax=Pseudomonas sp. F1_0610 TaxID=3114284 RepID=UPI0039C4C8F9